MYSNYNIFPCELKIFFNYVVDVQVKSTYSSEIFYFLCYIHKIISNLLLFFPDSLSRNLYSSCPSKIKETQVLDAYIHHFREKYITGLIIATVVLTAHENKNNYTNWD